MNKSELINAMAEKDHLWQENHLGKSKMIETAIHWFFSQEEEGMDI